MGAMIPHRGERDPDSFAATAANVVLAAAVPIVLFVAPLLVGEMIRELKLSVASAGYIVSIELGAMCLATIDTLWGLGRLAMPKAVVLALSLVIAGDAVSIWAASFAQLALVRALTGLGSGSIMALCLKGIGMTRNKDRNFGYWVMGQLVSGCVGLLVLPVLFRIAGLWAFYLGMVLVLTALMPVARFLPSDRRPVSSASPGLLEALGASPMPLLSIVGILLFYIAISGVWTYIERLGHLAHLESDVIGTTLAGATAMGVAGAAAASFLANKLKRVILLTTGFAVLALSIVLLLDARALRASCSLPACSNSRGPSSFLSCLPASAQPILPVE